MNIDEIISAIGGPTAVPHQPDGGSDVQALNQLGLDRSTGEPFPTTVSPQQGAGGPYLAPGAQGAASDGTVQPGNNDHYSNLGGPDLLSPSQGLAALTPDPSHGRPAGGTGPAPAPVGRPDTALGRDQSQGQNLNPALKWAEPAE